MDTIIEGLIKNQKYCLIVSHNGLALANGQIISYVPGQCISVKEKRDIVTHVLYENVSTIGTSYQAFPDIEPEVVFSESDEGEEFA